MLTGDVRFADHLSHISFQTPGLWQINPTRNVESWSPYGATPPSLIPPKIHQHRIKLRIQYMYICILFVLFCLTNVKFHSNPIFHRQFIKSITSGSCDFIRWSSSFSTASCAWRRSPKKPAVWRLWSIPGSLITTMAVWPAGWIQGDSMRCNISIKAGQVAWVDMFKWFFWGGGGFPA